MAKASTPRAAATKAVKPSAARPRAAVPRKRAVTVKKPAAPALKVAAVSTPAIKPVKTPSSQEVKAIPESEAKEKGKKIKLVRDSFTMPETEYAVLGEVKKACLKAGIEVKKSELLRVGVALIQQLDTTALKEILAVLPTLKAGRPKKNK